MTNKIIVIVLCAISCVAGWWFRMLTHVCPTAEPEIKTEVKYEADTKTEVVYVPKYIYVLSSVISNFVTFLISLIVLVGVGAVLKVEPSFYIVQAIVPLLILFVFTLGLGMILATLNVFFRDIEYIWTVATMLVMYASAIFYQTERIINTGNGWVFNINPVYMCISNFRDAVLYAQPMNMHYCLTSAVVAVITLIFGAVLFYKEQDKFILYV